jgi:hypothetical protein
MIIIDFIKWVAYWLSPNNRGFSFFEPDLQRRIVLSKIEHKHIVYKKIRCPHCSKDFWDYTGRKVCLRFRCFRKAYV